MTARSADDLLADARRTIRRVGPADLGRIVDAGGLLIDIRPQQQRRDEGELPGAIVVERNVLEWRLDPTSEFRLPQVEGYAQPVVVVCSEGYASSFAAATLRSLGFEDVADLEGGYQWWRSWYRPESVLA